MIEMFRIRSEVLPVFMILPVGDGVVVPEMKQNVEDFKQCCHILASESFLLVRSLFHKIKLRHAVCGNSRLGGKWVLHATVIRFCRYRYSTARPIFTWGTGWNWRCKS